MELYAIQLQALYNRIPRRHSAENLVEMNAVLDEYANILGSIESLDAWYEKNTAPLYPSFESIQATIKNSNSSKHGKKAKDSLFDDASGQLKDDILQLIEIYSTGNPEKK